MELAMRVCLGLMMVLLACVASFGQDDKVRCERGKCSAVFPAKPKLDADKTSDTYVLGENEDKHGYVLSVASSKLNLGDEEMIKAAWSKYYSNLRTSLGTKASKALQGTFGKEKLPYRYYEFDLGDGGVYWSRVVMTRDAIISITVSGPKSFASGEKAQSFLKSLSIDAAK